MRHLLAFGALTALALTSPAFAKDGSGYVGFDAGLLMPDDTDLDLDDEFFEDDSFELEHKNGYDIDLIAGYDFGFIRAEGELAWKRAANDEFVDCDDSDDCEGDVDVRSAMANAMVDFGNDKWNFYVGGGVGYALVRHTLDFEGDGPFDFDDDFKLKDGGFAWQGIAGVRYSFNEMIDAGIKYRYFDTSEMSDEGADFDFNSHSILFTFIYNWGGYEAPPPPPPPPLPPPPPPPPATQTCPDGSVILATDACPPPPPPPPPPPEPERG